MNIQTFDLARNALRYLIRKYKIKEIYIPYYLCNVIRHTVIEEKCKPLFYHIDDKFMPVDEFPLESYILYPNYFGICSKNVDFMVKKYPRLIVDNAHAFYAKPSGFACFNSSGKFLTENKGAFLWLGENVRENNFAPDWKRRETFLKYDKIYGSSNNLEFQIQENDIPFCYPYLAKSIADADALVKVLKKEGKIIYRYWNNLPKSFNEYKFYSRLIPIPLIDRINKT